MPRIHDPLTPNQVGPGSAVGHRSIAKRSRRRRKKAAHQPAAPTSLHVPLAAPPNMKNPKKDIIGEDLLDFIDTGKTKLEKKPAEATIQKEQETTAAMIERNQQVERDVVLVHHESQFRHALALDTEEGKRVAKMARRTALAIDTRFIDTEEGERVAKMARTECASFLRSLVERGATPIILSVTQLEEPPTSVKKTARAKRLVQGIRSDQMTSAILHKIGQHAEELLPVVPIRPPINSGNSSKNRNTVHVPKGLLAHASWKLFGDFVDSILARHNDDNVPPLDITILTNDVSFLSDTNETSHKRGVGSFWERVKPKFLDSKVRNLNIVMASTGTLVLKLEEESKDEQAATLSQGSLETCAEDTEAEAFSADALARQRDIHVAKCIAVIQNQLETLGETEFKANRSYLQFDKTLIPSINASLSTIENTQVGFKSLLRKFLRDSMLGSRKILLELPETSDGTHCSVSLDTQYKTLPFRLDSVVAAGLTNDLDLLSRSKFEVLQLVPIAAIDASLLFGVAFCVRAGLESDIDRHHEMCRLISALFTQLSSRECALLLRSEGPMTTADSGGLFHENSGAMFLLMAEEKGCRAVPNSGVLYRFASADHMLHETSPTEVLTTAEEAVTDQFTEFVENSLDCLVFSPVNPLYLDVAKPRNIANTAIITKDNLAAKSEWNDDTGVGSRGTPADTLSQSMREVRTKSNNLPWNDDAGGVGSRAQPATEDSEEISEIDTQSPTTTTKKNKINKKEPKQSQKKRKVVETDEEEWKDESGGRCSPNSNDDTDSDDDAGIFDYSP